MRHFIITLIALAAITAQAQDNPYINKVYEFMPAPGQFVNDLPEYEPGDCAEDMRLKAEECIANHQQSMISLGGWGGYVIFGFDHMIPNVVGEYDLKILGNAFYANANPKDTTALGGSAEPGIVMVSYDANHNLLPDDPWYELAGSEYTNPATIHQYTLTYHRPQPDHQPTPDKKNPYLSDTTYIAWHDNQGQRGYVARNTYHRQDYYPQWLDTDTITFTGSRLRNNGIDESGTGRYYVLYCFDWGYADNHPNQSSYAANDPANPHLSEFKIDWAVDEQGQPVQLPGINFVKVYTGVNQYNGWLGEASTEVLDAWDLHMLDADGNEITSIAHHSLPQQPGQQTICTIDGRSVTHATAPGLYIIRTPQGTRKTLVR